MTGPSPEWGVGVGGATVILAAGATWAALHLRGNIYARLKRMVGITETALDEGIVAEGRLLKERLEDLLPDSPNINPERKLVDPARVVKLAQTMARDYRMRARIQRQFATILVLATVLAFLSPIFFLTSLAATVLYFIAFARDALWGGLTYAAAVEVVFIFVLVGWYGILRARIQAAIEAGKVEP